MYGKFHDEEYAGVVLKIPNWFIDMNNLSGTIGELTEKLNACKLSVYHPDHLNNLYELENIHNKKEIASNRKRIEEDLKVKREKYKSDLLCGNIYGLEDVNKSEPLFNESIRFGNKHWEWQDFSTDKFFFKTAIKREILDLLKTNKDILDFANYNEPILANYLGENGFDFFLGINNLYVCNVSYAGISYTKRQVRVYEKNKRGNPVYTLRNIKKIPDGFEIDYGKKNIILKGYILKNNTLIKK